MINNKSKDVKSFLLFLAIVFGVLTAIMAVIATVNANKARKYDLKIFNDITECKGFLELNDKDTEITVYDKPDADKYLKDLPYTEFFAAEYISKELKFEIFAYEFQTSDAAKAYFENVTGIKSESSTNYRGTSGMNGDSRMVLIDNERAYIVLTKSHSALAEARRVLSEVFSLKLEPQKDEQEQSGQSADIHST